MTEPKEMLEALYAERPYEALVAKLRLYAQFVGSWSLDIDSYGIDGTVRRAEGEWHFSSVLGGRAIQDVWIFPSRRARSRPEPWHKYGATFRWYDPVIDAWHITWFDPTRPLELHQIGRAQGADIVQIGDTPDGLMRRWRFTDITDRSFRWIGDVSWDRGASWTLEMEMRARKTA